jgi:hypothetical protein
MPDLNVESVSAVDDGSNLNLVIQLRNDSDQTLHAQAIVRGIQYDPITKELRFRLTDRALVGSLPRSWYMLPRLVAIDPHGRGEIRLTQSRYLTRISPTAGGQAPTVEQLPAHEATSVVVEVAWSDQPFYTDPRRRTRKSMPEQVVDWERGVALGRSERRPLPPGSDSPVPGDRTPGGSSGSGGLPPRQATS